MEIAVCDDNRQFLEGFEKELRKIPLIDTIFSFSDYNSFLFSIDQGRRYDAVLLDIDWEQERTGLDIAEELYKLSPGSKIIYVTGNSDRFSQHIFLHKANLSGFLTKPVDFELLYANLKKVADEIPFQEQPTLVLRRQGAPLSVPLREIFYIESQGHTVHIHTVSETITVYGRLENLFNILPESFYRCHKSYIVNMNQIRRFQSSDALLKNGKTVPVSRARQIETKEAYFTYMSQML